MSAGVRLSLLCAPLLLCGCLGSGGGHSTFESGVAAPLLETIPSLEELVGVWRSTRISGGLEEVARAFVYAFRPSGDYTAAVLVDAERSHEWLALAGSYAYADGVLELGPEAPSFSVRKQGELLLLRGSEGNLILSPFFEGRSASPVAGRSATTPVDPEGGSR